MSYTSAKSRPSYTFDANLQLKDAGLVASSAAATVDSAAQVLDVGTGFFEGEIVIDVTAIEVDTGNELYSIALEGSSDSGFSSGTEVELCMLRLGDSSVTGSDVDNVVGRYTLPFNNRQPSGTAFSEGYNWRYLRLYTTVAGTIATGINYSAFIVKH
jgi:hypothetical protein